MIYVLLALGAFLVGCVGIYASKYFIKHSSDTPNVVHEPQVVTHLKTSVDKAKTDSDVLERRAARLSELLDIKQGGRT